MRESQILPEEGVPAPGSTDESGVLNRQQLFSTTAVLLALERIFV